MRVTDRVRTVKNLTQNFSLMGRLYIFSRSYSAGKWEGCQQISLVNENNELSNRAHSGQVSKRAAATGHISDKNAANVRKGAADKWNESKA